MELRSLIAAAAVATLASGCGYGTGQAVRRANDLSVQIAVLKDLGDERLEQFQDAEDRYLAGDPGALDGMDGLLRDELEIVGQVEAALAAYPTQLPDWYRQYLRMTIRAYDRLGRAIGLLRRQVAARRKASAVAGRAGTSGRQAARGGDVNRRELARDAAATYGRRAYLQLEAARRLGLEATRLYREEVQRNGLRSLKVPTYTGPIP